MNILVLRSYGDYIILLNSIQKSTLRQPIKLVVSKHLQLLHEAVAPQIPVNFKIEFIDFKIQKGILSIFTNKFFFSNNALRELLNIKRHFKNEINTDLFLEHKQRKSIFKFFTELAVKAIYNKGSVYESFNTFLNAKQLCEDGRYKIVTNSNVIVFPDSRKKNKEIDTATTNELCKLITEIGAHVTVAKFNFNIMNNAAEFGYPFKGYHNFKELVEIIQKADFILSSDSLPVHIAELFNKPHWILYNNKVNSNWLTPSSKRKKYYCTFHELHLLNNILK